jgi:hypothetical protein
MQHVYAFQSAAISSDELEMLQSTLKRWCHEQGIDLTSKRAEQGAIELIDWFQFGVEVSRPADRNAAATVGDAFTLARHVLAPGRSAPKIGQASRVPQRLPMLPANAVDRVTASGWIHSHR